MIKLNVLALLKEKGKSKYWLYKQLGMSYQNFNNMVENQTKSIRYGTMETLCQVLECTPNGGTVKCALPERPDLSDFVKICRIPEKSGMIGEGGIEDERGFSNCGRL